MALSLAPAQFLLVYPGHAGGGRGGDRPPDVTWRPRESLAAHTAGRDPVLGLLAAEQAELFADGV